MGQRLTPKVMWVEGNVEIDFLHLDMNLCIEFFDLRCTDTILVIFVTPASALVSMFKPAIAHTCTIVPVP